jgi:uncharacterized protein YbbC (DUF1343 family)
VSEGRGTTKPFEILGAPWIDPEELNIKLYKRRIPGISFRPTYFKPTFHKFHNLLCGGVQMYVENRKRFDPVITGLQIIKTISESYPEDFQWRRPPYEYEQEKMPFDILIGNDWVRKDIEKQRSINAIQRKWQADLVRFRQLRKKYLLYE